MIWAGALADLNDIELATFGQPVTVIVGSSQMPLVAPARMTADANKRRVVRSQELYTVGSL